MHADWSTRSEGQHQHAVSDFDSVIDRNPYNAPPYTARGQSLNALGKYDAALEDFTASLNVDNRNAEAWAGRGFAYEKLGKKTEASESYQRALSLDGNNATARAGQAALGGGGRAVPAEARSQLSALAARRNPARAVTSRAVERTWLLRPVKALAATGPRPALRALSPADIREKAPDLRQRALRRQILMAAGRKADEALRRVRQRIERLPLREGNDAVALAMQDQQRRSAPGRSPRPSGTGPSSASATGT